jgi:hypothetical protein
MKGAGNFKELEGIQPLITNVGTNGNLYAVKSAKGSTKRKKDVAR